MSVSSLPSSSVTLGTASVGANGQVTVSGAGGSGYDEQTIISAEVAQQQQLLTPYQDQITVNNSQLAALTQFNTLVTNLQTAAAALSNPPGFNQAANSAWDAVSTSVTSSTSVAGSNYLSVTATAGTSPQSYTLGTTGMSPQPAIIQLAQAQQVEASFSVSSANAALVVAQGTATSGQGGAGTFDVNGVAITLNQGDSLNDVAATFNTVSAQTGISATVIQIASGSYELQFAATQTGTANAFDLNEGDLGTAITNDTSAAFSQLTYTTVQPAQDSEFILNGQLITRSSNSVSDAISGLTFNLLQATPSGTTLSVSVAPNTTAAENGIVNFMNSYNDLMTFYAQQTKLNSNGTFASTAVLHNDSTLNSTVIALQSELSGAVNGLSGNYTSLGSLGITFTTVPAQTDSAGNVTAPAINNALTYNQTTLEGLLASNFSAVQQVFGFTFNSSNANLEVDTRTSPLQVSNFTVNFDPTGGVGGSPQATASYTDGTGSHTVNLTTTAFSSNTGYTFVGPAGSDIAGLTMIYGSNNAASINVTATQGVADFISNLATNLTQANTGGIAVDKNNLTTNTTSLNNTITQLNSQIAAYQAALQTEYTQLEQAISQANILMQTLNAQSIASLSSSG